MPNSGYSRFRALAQVNRQLQQVASIQQNAQFASNALDEAQQGEHRDSDNEIEASTNEEL